MESVVSPHSQERDDTVEDCMDTGKAIKAVLVVWRHQCWDLGAGQGKFPQRFLPVERHPFLQSPSPTEAGPWHLPLLEDSVAVPSRDHPRGGPGSRLLRLHQKLDLSQPTTAGCVPPVPSDLALGAFF